MKKTLILLRHGKSDWTFDLHDHDRPLNPRGKRDVPRIAQRISELSVNPQACFYSTAKRATDTALGVLKALHVNQIQSLSDLYTFDSDDVLSFITGISDELNSVLLVGHNPAYTELVNRLTSVRLDNLPTCGFAVIDFQIDTWSDISNVNGDLRVLEYPKLLDN